MATETCFEKCTLLLYATAGSSQGIKSYAEHSGETFISHAAYPMDALGK